MREAETSENGQESWLDGGAAWDGKGERKEQSILRASRILQIVHLISDSPRHWTRKMLANHFEISERQITKDLEIIRDGLKFQHRREGRGGYYFTSVPQLPAVSYSLTEAFALILAAEATRRLAGFPQQDLSMAMARLTSIMPEEVRLLVDRGSHAVSPVNETRERWIREFGQAIVQQRSVDIVYRAASHDGQEQQRRIDPYEIVSYGYSWHLLGWCHLREGIRDFK